MPKFNPSYNGSYYLERLYNQELAISLIGSAVEYLKTIEFDAIAFSGMSGALSAIPIAYKLNKPLILVRKKSDTPKTRHSNCEVEGCNNARTYIIIDDFISSGATVKYILKQMWKFTPSAKCLGVVELNSFGRGAGHCKLTDIKYLKEKE